MAPLRSVCRGPGAQRPGRAGVTTFGKLVVPEYGGYQFSVDRSGSRESVIGVVYGSLLSSGPRVRILPGAPKSPAQSPDRRLSRQASRSFDRHLTAVADVEARHRASRIGSVWHAGTGDAPAC